MSTLLTNTEKQTQHKERESVTRDGRSERTEQTTFSPRFDIWEGENELVLYGDLPGVDPADLNIEFENRQLSICGKVCRDAADVVHLVSEYGIGDFQRRFTIGEMINGDGITAELLDGVLTIRLPKLEEAKPRRIEVKSS